MLSRIEWFTKGATKLTRQDTKSQAKNWNSFLSCSFFLNSTKDKRGNLQYYYMYYSFVPTLENGKKPAWELRYKNDDDYHQGVPAWYFCRKTHVISPAQLLFYVKLRCCQKHTNCADQEKSGVVAVSTLSWLDSTLRPAKTTRRDKEQWT